jgi:hypothetical protein
MKLSEITAPKKVWALYYAAHKDQTELYGIFETKKLAEEARLRLARSSNQIEHRYIFAEIELNKVSSENLLRFGH